MKQLNQQKKYKLGGFMPIPQDPIILLSYINTQLRDYYKNLSELCENLEISEFELTEKLRKIQYEYDDKQNQFK
jgi:hypothetical protein